MLLLTLLQRRCPEADVKEMAELADVLKRIASWLADNESVQTALKGQVCICPHLLSTTCKY